MKNNLFEMFQFFKNFVGPECPVTRRMMKSNNPEIESKRIIEALSGAGTVVVLNRDE